jgi:nucleoside-diphosphate kinase
MERTLIILKPDAIQRGLAGEILHRLERRGLQIVGLKMIRIDQALAERHYAEHQGKPFYPGLVSYITAGPVVVGVLAGKDAVKITRNTVGATNPADAATGTIRGDLAVEVGRNLIHASDSPESGERETAIFFRPEELSADWARATDSWIHE